MRLLEAYKSYSSEGIADSLDYERYSGYVLTHHSTQLEGSTLTLQETELLLEKGIIPEGKPLEHSLMVEDHYRALKFVINKAKGKEKLSESFIQQIAARVMEKTGRSTSTALGWFNERKGEYRLTSAYTTNHYYPAYNKIPQRMKTLVARLESCMQNDMDIIEKYYLSFDAHFELVTIHPFGDGNGRTSRLLMNYIQAYYGLPITLVHMENRKRYIETLTKSREIESVDPIRKFMSNQAIKYFNGEVSKKRKKEKSQGKSFVF